MGSVSKTYDASRCVYRVHVYWTLVQYVRVVYMCQHWLTLLVDGPAAHHRPREHLVDVTLVI